jgi:hypothetical protein
LVAINLLIQVKAMAAAMRRLPAYYKYIKRVAVPSLLVSQYKAIPKRPQLPSSIVQLHIPVYAIKRVQAGILLL